MPEALRPRPDTPQDPYHTPVHNMLVFLGMVSRQCFSGTLLQRQEQLQHWQRDGLPVPPSASITLQAVEANGQMQHTYISDVLHIGENVHIPAGTIVGDFSWLGNNVRIGEGTEIGPTSLIDHRVEIGRRCLIEEGVTLLTGVTVEDECVVGQGVELNYDVELPAGTKLEPLQIISACNAGEITAFSR